MILHTKRVVYLAFLILIMVSSRFCHAAVEPAIIDYFYEKGCRDCQRVRDNVLPVLNNEHRDAFLLREHDIGILSNYMILVAYQDALKIEDDEDVCMVIDQSVVLNGYDAIDKRLLSDVAAAILDRSTDTTNPATIAAPSYPAVVEMAESRLNTFTWPAVAIAGLLDGLNPCAIGTLVFFMSLLTVSRMRNRQLLMIGIPFFIASFLTYTAIGFGLLRILHAFSGFQLIQKSIETGMIVLLAVLAVLSFADAGRYWKSGNPKDVRLQLPEGIKEKIHSLLRKGIRAKSLIIGALIVGALVTALESVCTGQVYVPTLVLVVKAGSGARMAGLGYLLLYNAMFILPLIAVFGAMYQGMKIEALIEYSKTHVVPSKILLGLLFIGLGALLLAL